MPFAGACCIIHPRNSIFSDSYGGLFGKVSFVLHLCLANVLLFRYFSQNALVVLAVIVKKIRILIKQESVDGALFPQG